MAVLSILAMLCKQSELARGQVIQAASLKAVIKALSNPEAQASRAAVSMLSENAGDFMPDAEIWPKFSLFASQLLTHQDPTHTHCPFAGGPLPGQHCLKPCPIPAGQLHAARLQHK